MAITLMSLGSIGFCVSMYIISQLDPNNVVLSLVSGNVAGATIKFVLLAIMLFVLLKRNFRGFWSQVALRFGSVGLILFGLTGMLSTSLLNLTYSVLRPLDMMLITEVGIIMTIISLRGKRIPQPAWRLHKILLPTLESLPRAVGAVPRLATSILAPLRSEQPRTAHQ